MRKDMLYLNFAELLSDFVPYSTSAIERVPVHRIETRHIAVYDILFSILLISLFFLRQRNKEHETVDGNFVQSLLLGAIWTDDDTAHTHVIPYTGKDTDSHSFSHRHNGPDRGKASLQISESSLMAYTCFWKRGH